jgi:hypothetical protein
MAVRLYLLNGKPAVAAADAWVIHAPEAPGRMYRTIDFAHSFPSQKEAHDFLQGRPPKDYIIGGLNPAASFIPLDGVPGLRLAYSSGAPGSVKVFERVK